MHLHEAYEELGLQEGASPKEVNDAFRKLSKKYHPDQSKEPDAEAKFKKINEAKQTIENPGYNQQQPNMDDFFGGFERSRARAIKPRVSKPAPQISLHFTFAESALGCERVIKYNRYNACNDCSGAGQIETIDSCKTCNGSGFFARAIGNMQFATDCPKCQGSKKEMQDCKSCSATGLVEEAMEHTINIRPGMENNSTVRLSNAGNFLGASPTMNMLGRMTGHQNVYGPLEIKVTVDKDPDMEINGENIISSIQISLLDSLKGVKRDVRTIKGDLKLKIQPNTRNGSKIVANGLGVGFEGDHIFNIEVIYPKDTSKLIEFLEKEK